ncbi:hypothetical protein JTB14_037831 [Gonioctena quinquepunctata]|nr:hypothetical protein JTB14_037831 [Gonioctena quinquepunctata]
MISHRNQNEVDLQASQNTTFEWHAHTLFPGNRAPLMSCLSPFTLSVFKGICWAGPVFRRRSPPELFQWWVRRPPPPLVMNNDLN